MSFGYMSTFEEAKVIIRILASQQANCFLSDCIFTIESPLCENDDTNSNYDNYKVMAQ